MGAFDAFFRKLEAHAQHAPPPRPGGTNTTPPSALSGRSGGGASGPDPRVWAANFGPDVAWEADTGNPEEAALSERASRLRAADAAAAGFSDVPITNVQPCPLHDPRTAIEVTVESDDGPLVDAVVELRRKAPAGVLTLRTDSLGRARFEGLRAGDDHALALRGMAEWSVEEASALPDDRRRSAHKAAWSAPAATTEEQHRVEEGECLWTLSVARGLDAQAVWQNNPHLHGEGRKPNVLSPGDLVTLAEGAPRTERVEAGRAIKVHGRPAVARARLRFQDEEGNARAGVAYVATVTTSTGDEVCWSGQTNDDGGFDEPVPAESVSLEVRLAATPDPEVYAFRFAHLDPVQTVAGVQGRLFNLGFWCGSERGEVGPLTRRALREFQVRYGLTESGEIDAATRSKLAEIYGA